MYDRKYFISHMYMIKFFKENQIIAGLGALKPILEELLFQVHMLAFWAIKMTQKLNSDIYLKELNLNVCHMNNIKIQTTSLLWSKNMLFLTYKGSVLTISMFISAVPLYMFCKKNLSTIKTVGTIVYFISFCNTAAWFLLGFFWRFSKAGRVCSGERIERASTLDN